METESSKFQRTTTYYNSRLLPEPPPPLPFSYLSETTCNHVAGVIHVYRGRILVHNGDKSFDPCYSLSPLLTDDPPPTLQQNGMKLCCDVNIVYRNLKSENSQDYDQKPQRNCTFMNSTSGLFEGN